VDIDLELAMRVRPWIERADRLIGSRVEDARSHAWLALTDRVVGAKDGRRTIQTAKSTRSMRAAESRLAELLEALAGPSLDSRGGLIRDARASFYRSAFELWAGRIPDAILDRRAKPTKAGEREARAVLIHGRELRPDVDAVIDAARRGLAAAVALAGTRGATDGQSRDALDAWAERHTQAIRRTVRTLLSDSDVAIYWGVGRSLVRPEFREES
jgi:hypothetical protein